MHLSPIKKPMVRINDVLIIANRNYVLVDFIVLDIECNPACHIILGRPFLRTVGAIVDRKGGNISFQFPLKKGMEHFPRNIVNPPYESIIRATYDLSLDAGAEPGFGHEGGEKPKPFSIFFKFISCFVYHYT